MILIKHIIAVSHGDNRKMGSGRNSANLTRLGDLGDRFSPADPGDGFQDQGLGNLAHLAHDLLELLVIFDGLIHLISFIQIFRNSI